MVIELFIERGSNKTCNGMLMGGLLFVASDMIYFYAKVFTLFNNGSFFSTNEFQLLQKRQTFCTMYF